MSIGLMNSFGIDAADDLVLELVALARLARNEANLRVAVLTAAARLLDVAAFAFGAARDAFPCRRPAARRPTPRR